jgi:hypothetical protein
LCSLPDDETEATRKAESGKGKEKPKNALVYLCAERNAASGTEASLAQHKGSNIENKATARLRFVI